MDWLDHCNVMPGLELDNLFKQDTVDIPGSTCLDGEQVSAMSSPPLWVFGNNVDPIDSAPVAEPHQCGSISQPVLQLPAESQGQTAEHLLQEPQRQAMHASSGSGSTTCLRRQITGTGKRSEAWNAKNRRAQKKFREKQKVTKDNMQQQLADMTAQLHAVETEHDQLTGRNSVLEKVLHVRQLQLEILQDQQQTKQQLHSLNPHWHGEPPVPSNQQKVSCKADAAPGFNMVPQPSCQPQAPDVNAVYAGIVDTMRDLLSKIARDGSSPDVEAALNEQGCLMGQFIKGTVLSNSQNLRKLYMVKIDPEAWDTTDLLYRQPEHWQAVTECLQLTPDQRAEMVRLRAECLAKQKDSQAQWHQLCDALAQGTVGDPACPEHQRDLSLDAKRLLSLRSTLHQGQKIWLELYQQVFGKVWSCTQYARAVVQSGPHHIDVMAIASCVAQQASAASQQCSV